MSKGAAGLSPPSGLAAAGNQSQTPVLGQSGDRPGEGVSLAPRWLEWGREIQALSQTGLHYAENEYQRERYTRLMEIAAEIVAESYGAGDALSAHLAGMDYPSVLEAFRAPTGYATPRVDVRGAVFQDGRLLLVREREDGGWTMPGGWADVGDVPSEAAEREVWEEAGFRVKATRVIGVYDANRVGPLELFHAFKLVFLCELIGGEATPSNETSEVRFFGIQELPENLSGERTRPRQIQDAFAVLNNIHIPTVFD